ncbi:uncharacterized protein LOC134038006 [Osmerus eperlanus]|uniref:uncharacterized protein LOC134038006 n=1 Tax=Osmerus eperlanus TaxID=29151 RepID=UPI002E0D1705
MVDHVLNHGLSMREAGQRVQPNLSRFTVAAIIRTFRMENRTEREPHRGGRTCTFTAEQETDIVKMVRENNTITLRQIQTRILADHATFRNIQTVSFSTLDRVLRRNAMRMKQVYRVLFDRNTDHIKELRQEFVLRIQEHDTANELYEYIFIDEVGFNLVKRRHRGRNFIGQRAIVEVPAEHYKILAKILALRLQGVLPQIISSDQTGFVLGRHSFHNTRRLFNILNMPSSSIPEVVVSLDAEEAFDRVE